LFSRGSWTEALQLAIAKESHIDTVLYFRKNYLANRDKSENIKTFKEMNQNIEIEWNDIKNKFAA
jgi:hypothetical protein